MSSLKIYGNFAFLVTSAVCMARPGSHTTILLSMFPKTGWQCRHKQAKAGSKGWYNVKRDVTSASKRSIRMFVITEKAPTRAFSWLKAATTAFTFKTLLRHYAKWALTPRSLNVKLGPRRNYHEGRAAIRHYANQTAFNQEKALVGTFSVITNLRICFGWNFLKH